MLLKLVQGCIGDNGRVRQLAIHVRANVEKQRWLHMGANAQTTMSSSVAMFHCRHRHMPIQQTSLNPTQ